MDRPATATSADELIVQAADEIDRSLIAWSLSMTILERLRACTNATRALSRFTRVASQDG